jgi:hypothetical protein
MHGILRVTPQKSGSFELGDKDALIDRIGALMAHRRLMRGPMWRARIDDYTNSVMAILAFCSAFARNAPSNGGRPWNSGGHGLIVRK